jgi:hypothetical protein
MAGKVAFVVHQRFSIGLYDEKATKSPHSPGRRSLAAMVRG